MARASSASALTPSGCAAIASMIKPLDSAYIKADGTGMVHSWPKGEHRTYEYGITENLRRRVFAEQ